MGKNIKSFSQFASYANRRKPEQPEEQIEMPKKGKKLAPLSTDVEVLKDEMSDKEQIKLDSAEWEIVNVIDVSTTMPDLSEQQMDEAVIVNADLGSKEIKRGDEIYITAMLKKKNNSWTQPDVFGVIKVRVVDIYNSLSILNGLK